jgi:hypothetical protein
MVMAKDQQLDGESVLQRVACPWFVIPWLQERWLVSDKPTKEVKQ